MRVGQVNKYADTVVRWIGEQALNRSQTQPIGTREPFPGFHQMSCVDIISLQTDGLGASSGPVQASVSS